MGYIWGSWLMTCKGCFSHIWKAVVLKKAFQWMAKIRCCVWLWVMKGVRQGLGYHLPVSLLNMLKNFFFFWVNSLGNHFWVYEGEECDLKEWAQTCQGQIMPHHLLWLNKWLWMKGEWWILLTLTFARVLTHYPILSLADWRNVDWNIGELTGWTAVLEWSLVIHD